MTEVTFSNYPAFCILSKRLDLNEYSPRPRAIQDYQGYKTYQGQQGYKATKTTRATKATRSMVTITNETDRPQKATKNENL